MLGDTRTAALVSPDGSIDWLCIPNFDGEPLFGALVGGDAAGRFQISPRAPATLEHRRYRSHAPIIETIWRGVDGHRLRLTEGMVTKVVGSLMPTTLLVRRVEALDADVEVSITFEPRRGYARAAMRCAGRAGLLRCSGEGVAVALTTQPPLVIEPGHVHHVTVTPAAPLSLALSVAYREPLILVGADYAWEALLADEQLWCSWIAAINDRSAFPAAATRSLITLRLLTYSPSGAPVAAPTTSLPELIGGARNWDYRYSWPRDASIAVAAFLNAGLEQEADAFLYFLLHASRLDRPRLPALFTITGKHVPSDRELSDWPGYRESAPVRVGNTAARQHQLDGYGWVLDAGWVALQRDRQLFSETWRAFSGMADLVAKTWRNPDAGIWEVRGEPRHYVHSKLMAWLTLDRALRIAATRHVRRSRRARWLAERDAIARQVRQHGVDWQRCSFRRAYGSDEVDAALLVVPLLEFEHPSSPLTTGTIDAVRRVLGAGGSLLYRYSPGSDGLEGGEAAFLPCSFWLAQALARTDRIDEAIEVFESTANLAGPLGLFGEECDPTTHEHLGNYPQALTHAALLQAAYAVRDATQEHVDQPPLSKSPSATP